MCLLFGPFAFWLEVLSDTLSVCDVGPLPALTGRVAEELTGCGFMASLKSTFSPLTRIFFLRKLLKLAGCTITSHPTALLPILAVLWRIVMRMAKHSRLTAKLMGFLEWHDRPKLGIGPFFAGAYC